MRKFAVVGLILLAVLMTAASAFAYADFTFVNQSLIRYDDDAGYFYAKIVNTGTTGAYIDNGNLKIYDSAGNLLIEETYVITSPWSRWLEPGEYVYAEEFIWDSKLAQAADFEFYVGQDNYGHRYTEIPSQGEIFFTSGSRDNHITVTVTNNTGAPLQNFSFVVAAYDANDNLIFVDSERMDELILHAGGTISVDFDISSSLSTYYSSKNMAPVRLEPCVFVQND